MTEDQKQKIARKAQAIYQIPEGTVILQEGEVNLDMYKILSGHVEVYVNYQTPEETLIGIIGQGNCFGEFGLLLHEKSIYTIVAYSDVTLFRITEGEMGDFVQQNHKNIVDIMRNMARTMLKMRMQIDLLVEDLEHGKKPNKREIHNMGKTLGQYALQKNEEERGDRPRYRSTCILKHC